MAGHQSRRRVASPISPTPVPVPHLNLQPKTTFRITSGPLPAARRPPVVQTGLPVLIDHAAQKTKSVRAHDERQAFVHNQLPSRIQTQPPPGPSYHGGVPGLSQSDGVQEKNTLVKRAMIMDLTDRTAQAYNDDLPASINKLLGLFHLLEGKCSPCWLFGLNYNHTLDNCTGAYGNKDDAQYVKFRSMLRLQPKTCFMCLGPQVRIISIHLAIYVDVSL